MNRTWDNVFPYLSVCLVIGIGSILSFSPAHVCAQENSSKSFSTVVEVNRITKSPEPTQPGTIEMVMSVDDPRTVSDTVYYEHILRDNQWYDPHFSPGSTFMAQITIDGRGNITEINLGQERRELVLLGLFGFLTVLLFMIGRWEGVFGLFCTLATLGAVYYLFFPWVLSGGSIIGMGLSIMVFTIVITVGLIVRDVEPAVPAIGALLVLTVGLIGLTIGGFSYLRLTGENARHSRLILTQIHRINSIGLSALWEILTVGIVLGTLGAMMDVAVVISSTVHEITRDQRDVSVGESVMSGMRVGREILSTMVNTLIFAYMGIFLPVFLALDIFNIPWIRFINYEFAAIEVLRLSVGLIGLALIIPTTSLFSAVWYRR